MSNGRITKHNLEEVLMRHLSGFIQKERITAVATELMLVICNNFEYRIEFEFSCNPNHVVYENIFATNETYAVRQMIAKYGAENINIRKITPIEE